MENVMALISFLLVPAIDLINAQVANSQLRFWVSVIVCAITGVLVSLMSNGGFAGPDVVAQDILAIFAMVQLVYKGYYEGSNSQKAIREGGPADSE